jgi:hypothetical protein
MTEPKLTTVTNVAVKFFNDGVIAERTRIEGLLFDYAVDCENGKCNCPSVPAILEMIKENDQQ